MNEYHRSVLVSAVPVREQEITDYQVNIDNFERAIAKIGDDEELRSFKEHLVARLATERLEQRKAQIMLEVIKEQLCS